ncbi:hypothetical protein HNQ51_001421 [Inhella inkyongensis]|uniref:DUF2059 domain-containing protein n=1 Tax=Inhella inkyongensis TaxID=392593 RepID=A0A840S3V5_9BURK|nr:hypothetical protein [Inhella inkyongensis]MBB5204128.1 hypothetical protein [Inhella inkyongensis]
MNSPTLLLSALALSLAAHFPAEAQSKKELLAKVVKVQQAQIEQFGSMLLQSNLAPMLQQVSQVLRSRVPEDKREATAKALDVELQAFRREVEPALRASAMKNAPEVFTSKLDASFNEAELKELLKYLESPVVKRYGPIAAESQGLLAQKIVADTKPLVESRMKALDQKMAEILGIKPVAAASSAKP